MRPILAEAVGLARRALLELQPTGVGEHLGVTAEDEYAATHHFAATLPGYRGWQWAVVVAAPLEAEYATVSESALLPGPDALVAPDFVPWDQRVRPGDLAPGDLLAPPADDPRLVPGYLITGDPVVDEVTEEIGLGRPQVLSREGREEAAIRWYTEYGPDTDMARSAPSTCGVCGFFVPLAGAFRAAFGVCANAMGADGHVVHTEYGCGAHSDTVLPTGTGSPLYEAYDDAAIELIPPTDLHRASEEVAAESGSVTTETDSAVAEKISSASPEVVETDAEVVPTADERSVPADEPVGEPEVAVGEGDSAEEGVVAEVHVPEARTSTPDSATAGVEADAAVTVVSVADVRSASVDEPVGESEVAGGEQSEQSPEAASVGESVVEAEDAAGEETADEVAGAEDSGQRGHYSDAWAVSAVRVKPGQVGGVEER